MALCVLFVSTLFCVTDITIKSALNQKLFCSGRGIFLFIFFATFTLLPLCFSSLLLVSNLVFYFCHMACFTLFYLSLLSIYLFYIYSIFLSSIYSMYSIFIRYLSFSLFIFLCYDFSLLLHLNYPLALKTVVDVVDNDVAVDAVVVVLVVAYVFVPVVVVYVVVAVVVA